MDFRRTRYVPVLDTLNFLRLWIKRPRSIGAVVPSSGSLATAIARGVDFDHAGGIVVELGAGTGSITRALVENAADPADIVVIEREASLCKLLSARFPDIRVICGDARNLRALLAEAGVGEVKAIVSGLPLLSMSRQCRDEIVAECFAVLPRDGVFVQFTYGLASPVRRSTARQSGIVGERMGWIVRNLPPASLWRYSREAGLEAAAT